FVAIDLTFFGANLLKVLEGGWIPLALGGVVMTVMYTWRRGIRLLFDKTRKSEVPLDTLVASLGKKPQHCMTGSAVVLTSDPTCAPTALMHILKHYKVLHENNVILTIDYAPLPRVDPTERVQITRMSERFSRIRLRFALWRGQTCRERLRLPASLAGSSKSCLPLSSFRGARSGLPCVPACRAGRIGCSSGSPVVPTTRPIISRFRPIAWSRSVPRSPCDFGDRRNDFATY